MHPDAAALIAALGLAPHPEGGFYRETFRSSATTAIFFLLPAGAFSALHRVHGSDEVWHHYGGDPVELHVIGDRHEVVVLGPAEAGYAPQAVVPAGAWQAAVPRGERYALCGCTVAPAFDFTRFELPSRAELLESLPGFADLVRRLTREAP